MRSLTGIGVSPGVVLGSIFKIEKMVIEDPVPASPREIYAALSFVAEDLEKRAFNADLDIAREVLQAQAMIAQDPALIEAIGARLKDDVQYPDVRPAIKDAFAGFRQALESLGGYFAERVSDLDEICERTIAFLAGKEMKAIVLSEPSIVIAEDLTPADTAALDLNFALALVVSKGGPTSHTAIVARGLGIPAVVGCDGVMQLKEAIRFLLMADTESLWSILTMQLFHTGRPKKMHFVLVQPK